MFSVRFQLIGFIGVFLSTGGIAQDSGPSRSDPRVDWLRDHAVPLRTIDPKDADFADLEPLRSVIGTAELVLLGEQSHGDGATMLAKSRLIRFLHERMGFDVVAFESGLWSVSQTQAALRAGELIADAAAQGLFGNVGQSAQARALLEYARASWRTPRPLILAGFDIQFSMDTLYQQGYRRAVERFFDLADSTLLSLEHRRTLRDLFGPERAIGNLYRGGRSMTPEEFAASRRFLEDLLASVTRERERLRTAHSDRAIAFFERTLRNFRTLLAHLEELRYDRDPRWTAVRDSAMANNLQWLLRERYRGRKLIGWAHSGHIMRNADVIDTMDSTFTYRDEVPMGHELYERLGERVYTVGFLAYEGTRGRWPPSANPIEPAPEGSLDWLLHQVGEPYLFLDLRGVPEDHWLRNELVARPIGYLPMRAAWTEVFDAVVFTDRMFPNVDMRGERR